MTRRGVDLWPGWFYGPGGASKLCETEADVPKGWTDSQVEAAKLSEPKGKKADDAAAKPSTEGAAAEKPVNPLAVARKAYIAKFGKNPSPKWDADTLNAKIAEAPETEQQHDL